jgi:hypothetical protein
MSIGIFRKPYIVRRFGTQQIVNGYAVPNGYTDRAVKINVQPLSKNDLLALPEGKRTVKRIKSYGANAFISADEQTKTNGDLLYYDNEWYECKTCVHWLHTPLAHYEAEFVVLDDRSKQLPPNIGDTDDDS